MQLNSYDFLLIFSAATVGMLLLAGAIVIFVVFYQKKMIQEQFKRQTLEFDYQQKMMQAELSSQESERRRLAADLHDSIGGMLSTIRVGLSTLGRSLPDPTQMDETKKMLDDTISSVRRISRDLMPSTLEKFGLVHAVKELCERFQSTSRIPVNFDSTGEVSEMDPQRELMVFRIIQELLNNAIKHSKANVIDVKITVAEKFYATVEDDGIGFNAEEHKKDKQSGKGLGLFNIENRARLLNGNLEFISGREKGSKILLTIPLSHEKTA
jgi:two-component system, NarL family, sensor kinase